MRISTRQVTYGLFVDDRGGTPGLPPYRYCTVLSKSGEIKEINFLGTLLSSQESSSGVKRVEERSWENFRHFLFALAYFFAISKERERSRGRGFL
jgi:hypothetical protein